MDILNSMIKSSSDNYSKSSAECLVIGLCLYVAITFHNNLIEAKIVKRKRWRQRGRVVRAPDLKSVGREFKSRSDR